MIQINLLFLLQKKSLARFVSSLTHTGICCGKVIIVVYEEIFSGCLFPDSRKVNESWDSESWQRAINKIHNCLCFAACMNHELNYPEKISIICRQGIWVLFATIKLLTIDFNASQQSNHHHQRRESIWRTRETSQHFAFLINPRCCDDKILPRSLLSCENCIALHCRHDRASSLWWRWKSQLAASSTTLCTCT